MRLFLLAAILCMIPPNTMSAESGHPAQPRVWIDTDPACNGQRGNDPDDCLALYALGRSDDIEIVGVSATFGNVPAVTAQGLLDRFIQRARTVGQTWPDAGSVQDICDALSNGPLQIIALGPLTNIAAALETCPHYARQITRIVFVGGRRAGHVFHPAEDARRRARFGHGPIFRDLNVIKDPAAVRTVLSFDIQLWLAPYELARQYSLTNNDLATMARQDALATDLYDTALPWLAYWRDDIGRDGFYPFDLMAAAVMVSPDSLNCQPMRARVKHDTVIGGFSGPLSLILDDNIAAERGHVVQVCLQIRSEGSVAIGAMLIDGGQE